MKYEIYLLEFCKTELVFPIMIHRLDDPDFTVSNVSLEGYKLRESENSVVFNYPQLELLAASLVMCVKISRQDHSNWSNLNTGPT